MSDEQETDILRIRKCRDLIKRLDRIADRRGSNRAAVAREGIIVHVETEEARLNIPKPQTEPVAV